MKRVFRFLAFLPVRLALAIATLAVMFVAGATIAAISFLAVLFGDHFRGDSNG